MRGTISLADARVKSATSAPPEERRGRDPEDMEREAARIREQEAELEAALEAAERALEDTVAHRADLERELALVKVRGTGHERVEALRVSDIFRAKVIDTTHESFVFELTGAPSKIDRFVDLMRPLGLVEVSRTGVLSIQRGVEAL